MSKINIYGELASGIKGGYVTSADQIRNMSAVIRNYKNVEFFDGFRDGDRNYREGSSLSIIGVHYLLQYKVFAGATLSGDYWANWSTLSSCGADYNVDGAPRTDRIFEDITTGKRYVWDVATEELIEYTS